MPNHDELPTGEEMAVMYWASIVVTLLVGFGSFYLAAKADAQENAIALRIVGSLSLIVAVLIVAVTKIISIFLD